MFSLCRIILISFVLGASAAVVRAADVPVATFRHGTYVHAVVFSPDGQYLASASNDQVVRIWDVRQGKELHALAVPKEYVHTIAFSPDGKMLAAGTAANAVSLWDVKTGRAIGRLREANAAVHALAFSPDGKLLVHSGDDKVLRVWDLAEGKEVRHIESTLAAVHALAFSPDGKSVAGAGRKDHPVIVWDIATGVELRRTRGRHGGVAGIAFAPDGRVLASAGESPIRLWDAASMSEWGQFAGRRLDGIEAVAFAPDGKFIASGGKDKKLRLWERATRQEVLVRECRHGWVVAVAFAADGRRVATGDLGNSVDLWDVTEAAEGKPELLSPERLTACWNALLGTDAAEAYRATWALAHAPEQALPFLKEQLRKAPTVKARQIQDLLVDLASEDFERRQKAVTELERLNELAEPVLRQKLAEKLPSLELRRRIERIVDNLGGPLKTPEALCALRVTAVLERIGTPEARQLLESLAKGADEAWLPREAKEALRRLKN